MIKLKKMQNIKNSSISLIHLISKTFAYKPLIKFLGPRHLLQSQPLPNNSNSRLTLYFKNFFSHKSSFHNLKEANIQKNERKLKDLSDYKHEFSMSQRQPIELEEVEAINSGGIMCQWRNIKKIKIVKEQED